VPLRPGPHLLGLPVRPFVATEVLLAAVVVGAVRRDPAGLAVALLATAGLVLLLARTGGRPLWRELAVRAAAGRRRRGLDDDAPDAAAAVLGPLAPLAPSVAVTSVDLRPGRPLGVLADAGGWTAVVALGADEDVLDPAGPPPVLPGEVIADALAVDDVRLAAVQVLVHVRTAPDPQLPAAAPAATAYGELPPPAVPADRQAYVVLRLEPATGGDAVTARGGGTTGAARALRRVALRLTDRLESAGITAGPVAAQGVADVVALLAKTGAGAVTETRTALRTAGGEHTTWRVEAWPDAPFPAGTLAGVVAAVPAATTTLALTVSAAGDGLAVRAHVRTTDVSPEAAARSAQALRAGCEGAGLRLRRLDGEHGPGLLATLPRTAGAAGVDGRGHVAHGPADVLDLPLAAAGVTAGHDAAGPVALRLFRSRPTQVALVTSTWVARLLALRAQAVGGLVEVASSRPDTWLPVVTAAPAGRAAVVPVGTPVPGPAMLLRCDDAGPAGGAPRADVGPWQARFAVQDFLPATAVAGLRGFDLVVVQRVGTDVLAPLAAAFGIADDARSALAGLPDDVVALLAPGTAPRFVRLAATPTETRLLGPAVRHDG
jgi:type VII secretion protein EccE